MNEEVIYPSMVIRSQAEAIELLEKENKQLKEQLLVSQTNEETFRLEMEDITKTLGLDEDTIFDDVKAYARSLKEKYINAVADYETTMSELQELKKQLEEKENIACNWKDSCLENAGEIEKLENQQKEFIEYLEDSIKQNETVVEVSKYGLPKNCSKLLIDFYKEILSKFKSIIGSKE